MSKIHVFGPIVDKIHVLCLCLYTRQGHQGLAFQIDQGTLQMFF